MAMASVPTRGREVPTLPCPACGTIPNVWHIDCQSPICSIKSCRLYARHPHTCPNIGTIKAPRPLEEETR